MADAYDLRSNIKGKPGSQGTLFQVKDKGLLNPAQRWPRGYTPERQAEVSAKLDNTRFTTRNVNADVGEQRARVVDVVSRSTIPARHLSLLQQVDDTPMNGTRGTYYPQSHRLHVDMHGGQSGDAESSATTLVHELGHHHASVTPAGGDMIRAHVSDLQEKAGRAFMPAHASPDEPLTGTARAMGGKAVEAGVHEAYADTYMVEHYRSGGRKQTSLSSGHYEQNFTPEQRDAKYPGYNDVRPPKQPEHINSHQFEGLF